jgi:hypothetical protein
MRRDKGQETVKASHGGEGGGGVFQGERAGGGQDARVNTALVVEEEAGRTPLGRKAGEKGGDVLGGKTRRDFSGRERLKLMVKPRNLVEIGWALAW